MLWTQHKRAPGHLAGQRGKHRAGFAQLFEQRGALCAAREVTRDALGLSRVQLPVHEGGDLFLRMLAAIEETHTFL